MSTALQKMVGAIEAIGARPAGITVSELAQDLSVSVPAASRMLSSLVEAELISRAHDTQRHVLHPRLWTWGVRATRDARRLYAIAGPMMAEASREADARFVFSVIHGNATVLFAGVTPTSSIVSALPMEDIIPVHACAPGKAMLAYQHPDLVDSLLSAKLERYTEFTITSREALEEELAKVRELGYATNREEYVPNRAAVAVPIFDWRGEAIASVSAGGKSTDEEIAYLDELVPHLKRLGDSISSVLGHTAGA